LKVLGNLKWTGEDPAWRKIEFIDRTYLESDDPHVLKKEIEHLKLEKGELAAHLEKTQTLLKTRGDIEQDREKMLREELNKVTL
jgi:protein fantom